jgi:UDP-GlcNAc:undecaprenyl-phosphate GlcNAc-1-phosphate transferase
MTFLKSIPERAELVYFFVFDVAFFLGLLFTPLCCKWSVKWGLLDDPGQRKIHNKPIPLLGGLAVFMAFVLTVLAGFLVLWLLGPKWGLGSYTEGAFKVASRLFVILFGGMLMVALGMRDDREDLHAWVKLAGQIFVGLFIALSGLRIHLFLHNVLLSYVITVAWVVVVTNAMNFFDNMDGLCGGVGLICAAFFGLIAAINGQFFVCVLSMAFCGGLLGFLPYNFSPARIFLGDAGSHFVGYMLSVLTILATFYASNRHTALALIIPLIVLSVPLFDMLAVSVIRMKNGQPVYRGDVNHISHRLVRAGLPKPVAVWVIYLVTFALSLSALVLLWANIWTSLIVLLQCVVFLSVVTLLEHFGQKKQAAMTSAQAAVPLAPPAEQQLDLKNEKAGATTGAPDNSPRPT